MKKRLDQRLVDLGLAPSRAKAQEMIERGEVEISSTKGWQKITKVSFKVDDDVEIQASHSEILKYVSRAGLKLERALTDFCVDVRNKIALDLGQSTGGFTDCLLQNGAREVFGVDVAKDELHEKIKSNPRVFALGGINVKDLRERQELSDRSFDLVVADLSFISLTKVLSVAAHFMSASSQLLALIKPQFELSREDLNKRGIVIDIELQKKAVENVVQFAKQLGFSNIQVKPSHLKGRDGNQEYFLYAEKNEL